MAKVEVIDQAQTEAIARGLRFDAAEQVGEESWRARASASPERGRPVEYIGEGKTPEAAHRALIRALPPKAGDAGPVCPLCGQSIPEGKSLATPRYDAPE